MHFNIMVHQRSVQDARKRAQRWRIELCTIVIDLVHPENLGPLPPAPRFLEAKAAQMGLLTFDEVISNIRQHLPFGH